MRALRPSAAILLGAVTLLSGCVATQQDVLDLESQSDQLKAQITNLNKTVNDLQANQADLAIQMKQLGDNLGTFTEAVRENQDEMTKLSSKLDDMSAAVATKVAQIGSSLTTAQQKSFQAQQQALQKAEQERLNSPTELFNTADVRLALRDYALAEAGFSQYVQKFPDGALIDAATFKLAQSYYGQKKWKDAGQQFALFLQKFPKSDMIPSARLYYALCLLDLGRGKKEAREYLESIVSDYPKSPEAKQAAQYLKKLARARRKTKSARR